MVKDFLISAAIVLFCAPSFGNTDSNINLNSVVKASIQDLMYDCETEFLTEENNGSCLLVGVMAIRADHKDLHRKIEDLCIQHVTKKLILNSEYFEGFLGYFPKCSYIYKDKLKKDADSFHSSTELKTLVRFLNM